MQTALQFGPVLIHLDRLLAGLVQTIELAVLSILIGTVIGVLGAIGRASGRAGSPGRSPPMSS